MGEAELPSIFSAVQRAVTELDTVEPAQQQALVRDTINQLLRIGQLIREASIFSPNETLQDISTEDLRYLLAPAYLGDLVVKLNDRENRVNHLEAAEEYIQIFLRQCKRLELLRPEDEMCLDNREPDDPVEKRKLKISRYTREKQSKERLRLLTESVRNAVDNERSEVEREHMLVLLDMWIQRSCDSLGFLRQEKHMLEEIDRIRESNEGKLPPPLPPPRAGFKPFVLTRDMVKVFGAGYPSLPTLTPEQAAAREHDMGLHKCGGGHDTKRPEVNLLEEDNETGMRAQDEQTYKDRKWAEFTDENPYGHGNRYNKS